MRLCISLSFVLILLIPGCGVKVMYPPEIDLGEYDGVGLIEFISEAEGKPGAFVTQKFLEEISLSQKGVRIIALGTVDEVLSSVNHDRMAPPAIQAIGRNTICAL